MMYSPPVTVFLRNLALLQLNQQPDWPNLSARLFTGGQQTQRQRVKGVEWALYHLFNMWDPEITRNKLRPFFPPLEPLQSLNLRAALVRALSDARKNGDWGREIVVRKTILDDCSGDKCEELLAVFSTAVLRKVVATHPERFTKSPSVVLATAKAITAVERDRLVPLIIAHHGSLHIRAKKRDCVQSSRDRFVRLLETKAAKLADCGCENPLLPLPEAVPGSESLIQEVKGNWLGGEEWADALLTGGPLGGLDSILARPFTDAYSCFIQDTAGDSRALPVADLVLELDTRLSRQRERLRRWQALQESLQNSQRELQSTDRNYVSGSELKFQEHRSLTVPSLAKTVHLSMVQERDDQYQSLLSSMDKALGQIKGPTTHFDRPVSEPLDDQAARRPLQVTVSAPATDTTEPTSRSLSISGRKESAGSPIPQPRDRSKERKISRPELEIQHQTPIAGLVERTRQSMSLLPSHGTSRPDQPTASHLPRQTQQFPVNQFETPPRRIPSRESLPPRSGASTPLDELFSKDADYASVFKSRPRVATSPLLSPIVHVGLEGDGAAGSGKLDLASSPLASVTIRTQQGKQSLV